MNTMRSTLAALFGGALLFTGAAVAPAQSVVTEPVGFTTLTVAAKPAPTGPNGFTYLSVNMFRPTAFRGAVTSAATTTLTFPASSFTASQFTGAANRHYLEITNGTRAGTITDITANTTNTITVADDVSALITGGTTTVRIRPYWTFGTLFGANTPGFQSGNTAALSDTIVLLDPVSGTFTTYFYRSTSSSWRTSTNVDATNAVIPPDQGLLVERKATSPVTFTVTGEVKLGPTETLIAGGNPAGNFVYAPNPYPLASIRLQDSNLYTGDPNTGVFAANTAALSDTVVVLSGGVFTTYFYRSTSNSWRTSTNVDATNATIPEGAAVLINRKAGRPAFSWYIPQPTMNL